MALDWALATGLFAAPRAITAAREDILFVASTPFWGG